MAKEAYSQQKYVKWKKRRENAKRMMRRESKRKIEKCRKKVSDRKTTRDQNGEIDIQTKIAYTASILYGWSKFHSKCILCIENSVYKPHTHCTPKHSKALCRSAWHRLPRCICCISSNRMVISRWIFIVMRFFAILARYWINKTSFSILSTWTP